MGTPDLPYGQMNYVMQTVLSITSRGRYPCFVTDSARERHFAFAGDLLREDFRGFVLWDGRSREAGKYGRTSSFGAAVIRGAGALPARTWLGVMLRLRCNNRTGVLPGRGATDVPRGALDLTSMFRTGRDRLSRARQPLGAAVIGATLLRRWCDLGSQT